MPSQKPNTPSDTSRATFANKMAKGNAAANVSLAGKNIKQEFLVIVNDVKKSVLDYVQNFQKFRDIVKNNYELGRMHLRLGNLKDALMRLKFVLWIDPAHIDAMYYLGATYMAMGKKKQAADFFVKALKLRPDFEEAKYLLCVVSNRKLSKEQMPKSMPLSLAVEYFDAMAPDYNNQQLQVLKYEGHIQLDNALRACVVPGRMDHVVLELGVGTGLCGTSIRDIAAHITGVDFSAAMLEEAMKVVDRNDKKIYDALIKREALDFLKDAPDEGYDVVLSAGMMSYVGDISGFFEQAKRVLKSKGLFAFTADVLNGDGYEFVSKEARFAFSKGYIQELASRFGFKELKCKDFAVYAEFPAWVCVYEKP